MIPKVLVGAPVCDLYEYCFDEFINNLKNLSYGNYDILLVDNSKEEHFYNKLRNLDIKAIRLPYNEKMRERVVLGHNTLREYALKEDYDYLLVLDQDIIPSKDVIENLIKHNKDAVSALYFGHHVLSSGENKPMPFAWTFIEKKDHWGRVGYLTEYEVESGELIEIAFSGMGCVLLSRNALEKVKFRYDLSIEAWDDRWLGYDLSLNGLKFYLDTSVICRHMYLKRPFNYHEIKKQGLV